MFEAHPNGRRGGGKFCPTSTLSQRVSPPNTALATFKWLRSVFWLWDKYQIHSKNTLWAAAWDVEDGALKVNSEAKSWTTLFLLADIETFVSTWYIICHKPKTRPHPQSILGSVAVGLSCVPHKICHSRKAWQLTSRSISGPRVWNLFQRSNDSNISQEKQLTTNKVQLSLVQNLDKWRASLLASNARTFPGQSLGIAEE